MKKLTRRIKVWARFRRERRRHVKALREEYDAGKRQHADGEITRGELRDIGRRLEAARRLLDKAENAVIKLKRERRQARKAKKRPKVVVVGLGFVNKFGALGPELYVTGHHTAGPKDGTWRQARSLARSYHAQHARQGWGGIGYHVMFAREPGRGGCPVILLLRPTLLKGAHVGGHNTSNLGQVCNGTTGDQPTETQMRALRWYLANAHTDELPRRYRTDRDLRGAGKRGHNDWDGHEWNACPGTHKRMYLTGGRDR